jgi:hypothetical protein
MEDGYSAREESEDPLSDQSVSDRWRPFLQEATAAIEGDANKPQK